MLPDAATNDSSCSMVALSANQSNNYFTSTNQEVIGASRVLRSHVSCIVCCSLFFLLVYFMKFFDISDLTMVNIFLAFLLQQFSRV